MEASRPSDTHGTARTRVTTTRLSPQSISPHRRVSTLRAKTLLIVLVTSVGLLSALVIPLYTIILNSFVQLEAANVRTDVQRGLNALDARIDSLRDTALNLSAWNATHGYPLTQDATSLQSSLQDSNFTSARINVVALYDTTGHLVFGKAYDFEAERPMELPQFFQCNTGSCGDLLAPTAQPGSKKGLVRLPQGPAIVVSVPIPDSRQQGASSGTLVLARQFDQAEITGLSQTTSLNLTFQNATSPDAASASTIVQPLNDTAITGSTVLNDILGKPALTMTVTDARSIYNQGRVGVLLSTMALVVAGLVFCFSTIGLIEKVVLSRLSRLSARVAAIGTAGGTADRVSIGGNDELSRLAENINSTLSALERSYQARSDTEASYRAVVEQTTEAICLVDATSGLFVESNLAFKDLLGYSAKELHRLTFSDVVVLDDKSLDSLVTDVLSDKRLQVGEIQYRRKDGSLVDVTVNASHINRNTDEVVCFVAHDLTERKAVEAERALRLSEERFRSLVQNAADIISIVDREGTIQYQSPSVENILGYDAANMVGTDVFSYLHGDDVATAQDALLSLDTDSVSSRRTLVRARHADGSWRYLEAIGANLIEDPNVGGLLLNIRDVTERKALEDRLTYQAFHDPLTGLPNRMFFNNRLQLAVDAAASSGSTLAVVFLDIDNFKVVNDSLGHEAGDKLLMEVAARLRSTLRSSDAVARFGGDEFTFLFETDVTEESVAHAVDRIRACLVQPLLIDGHEITPASSIGIVVSTPDSLRPEELLRNADIALYRAKRNGKAQSAIYQSDMRTDAIERLLLEIDLRRAIERNELLLYYQPLVELGTGKVTGVECLLRWRHPVRGIVAPNDFIPLAEENGMIIQMGLWALERACYQAKSWQSDPAITPALTVSVNISARQFRQPDLVQSVARVLEQTGLAPQSLKLEITESIGMEDAEMTLTMLTQLKELGVSLALDDFGMGHSALSYLKRFPIDTLKLDRIFVSGLGIDKDDTAIVQAAIQLAQAMGLDITAEGVETREQIQALYSLGCDHGQGFFFARPMPAFAMETYLKVKRVQLQDASTRDLLSGALKDHSTSQLTTREF